MSDTIAAVATPLSAGGIGVIRISGESAIEMQTKIYLVYGEDTVTD